MWGGLEVALVAGGDCETLDARLHEFKEFEMSLGEKHAQVARSMVMSRNMTKPSAGRHDTG